VRLFKFILPAIIAFVIVGRVLLSADTVKAGGYIDFTIPSSKFPSSSNYGNSIATIPFAVNFNLSLGEDVERVEVLSASADNGLSYSFNGSTNIYYGNGDCDTNDPNDIYPDNYNSIWTYYSGANIKSDLIDGSNTISGTLYNCTGGPYSVSDLVIRIYYYSPTCSLTVSGFVFVGESPVLSWVSQNASTASIDNGIGNVSPVESGSIAASPIISDTVYTMTVRNIPGDVAYCSVLVKVKECKAGLVPCGRMCDVATTSFDERAPCTLCALVLMVQLVIEFLVKLAAVVALFAITAGGLLYMFSSGNQSRMEAAKIGIKYALLGFVVIFIAWAVVATILAMLGYIDPLNGEWYVVNC